MQKDIQRKIIVTIFLLLIFLTLSKLTTIPTQAQTDIANMIFLPIIVKDIVVTEAPTPTITPIPNCDPSYPSICIPPPPPDLDCGEIEFRNFTVLQPDPHGFDTDNDGIGCES